jgi:hypothetical protein
MNEEKSVNWSDGIATSNVCVCVCGCGECGWVKLLEQMTEGYMLGLVRIIQQLLSDHLQLYPLELRSVFLLAVIFALQILLPLLRYVITFFHSVLSTYDLILFT